MTLLATIIVLGVLIFVHELGHFLAAKWVDIRVERFSIGLGGAGAVGGAGRGRGGPGVWAARALSSRALSVTRGLRGALGAKTPW